ncbi:MAG: TetR/AcrR family transcriptional regulator [Azospira sp.]|jgi:AcrR family transcriptional regulator|nr:TetR/AcrR family transcriptional regulator [Azospira sp.]
MNDDTRDTRQKLLDAAMRAFAENGYRSCVGDIACRAGVARQTLYHHFSGKDELFTEAIKQMASEIGISLDGPVADLRAALLRFARTFREKIQGEPGLSLHRVLVAEAPRVPQLAQAIFAAAPGQTARLLTGLIGRAMDEGHLRHDDPAFAADMLMSMLTGMERSRRLLASTLPTDDAPERAERIVDCFLRAFAPACPDTPSS